MISFKVWTLIMDIIHTIRMQNRSVQVQPCRQIVCNPRQLFRSSRIPWKKCGPGNPAEPALELPQWKRCTGVPLTWPEDLGEPLKYDQEKKILLIDHILCPSTKSQKQKVQALGGNDVIQDIFVSDRAINSAILGGAGRLQV